MSAAYGGLLIILSYGKGIGFAPPPPADARITDALEKRITDNVPDTRIVD